MKFEDEEIKELNIKETKGFIRLIINFLCGRNYPNEYYTNLETEIGELLTNAIKLINKKGLSYEQLNEILLLLKEERVGKDFFTFFFGESPISIEGLIAGVVKFRGYSLLCFGNFRFAFKELIHKNEDEINEKLFPFSESSENRKEKFENRCSKILEINQIEKENTWYNGELTGTTIEKDFNTLKGPISGISRKSLVKFEKQLVKMGEDREEVKEKAKQNTDIYLTCDYMDVYLATSMRNKWEFEETYDFKERIFNDKKIKSLKLRYFDPTQSICRNSRDKGLCEGLMLSRVLCTIYMAQESDSMGKDSELAATLAQSIPVIAYVPSYELNHYASKISNYPLYFFKRRILILQAEDIFSDSKCQKKLKKYDPNYWTVITEFLDNLETFIEGQPFLLWTEKEDEFKQNNSKNFKAVCKILAIAEIFNFDRRASLLGGRHPLCMQVDLRNGVSNGVLVVRKIEDCIQLLYNILTNQMEFSVQHERGDYTILKENISKCAFRVITDNERLTNSFWSLFSQNKFN